MKAKNYRHVHLLLEGGSAKSADIQPGDTRALTRSDCRKTHDKLYVIAVPSYNLE